MEREPAGRFEWERIVRRAQLTEPVKYLAFVLASYADPDGSRVRPGHDVLGAVTGKSDRTVRRLLTELLHAGLLELVARGGGRGRGARATVYRLTIPTDLLDRLELLPPSEHRVNSPAIQVSGQFDYSADTQMSGQLRLSPVDNSNPPDAQVAGQSNGHGSIDRPLANTFGPIDRPLVTD